ncbi:MAG: permease [Candidatus Omnitrophica bacterium]|nr:permease [Candidatus Omnitrophota bacterium]
MSIVIDLIQAGWNGLLEYLSAHVITCLVPALFIAGAIAAFVSQAAILKYFGPKANKLLSYSVASVSGTVLAVCSCTVLPLFAGIFKRGAGLGPAIAFLFSGPAINTLAIVYSAKLLGYDIGIARIIGAIIFSVVIGLIMAFIYRKDKSESNTDVFANLETDPNSKSIWQQVAFIGTLIGILVFAASKNWIVMALFFVVLAIILWRWFKKDEIVQWLKETLHFTRLIIPWLLLGVFIAGILTYLIPQSIVADYVGGNTITGNFIASIFGAFMYFATLTEVPIIKAFLDLGMGKGPALALLLAGPALSLPAMFTLSRIMGIKKTLTYVGLIVIMATITGYIFGFIAD